MRHLKSFNLNAIIGRAFPEQRLFLRSDGGTRFVRLAPATQVLALSGSALLIGWTIISTAILLMDTIGSGNVRDQARREQTLYEQRLNDLSAERDLRAEEARQAIERFNTALAQVSDMQSALLASETRRRELEKGIDVTQQTLRKTLKERDEARRQVALLNDQDGDRAERREERVADMESTLDMVTAALSDTAEQRDAMAGEADDAEKFAENLILDAKLKAEENERIFSQLEDALTISVAPLEKMFKSAGLSTDKLLDSVRRGYSGQGGPLTPISLSTKGGGPDADSLRANSILEKLDRMNLYRIAAEKAPFAMPLQSSFRYSSPFGRRWGRMHEGVDMAGPKGTKIYATADGVVTHAGWMNGYGNVTIIKHDFGFETRFGHQSKIRVKVGQKVSRGEWIGDMGNTGRSTGNHLHYEVRVNGTAVNPMTYIKAAKDVF